MYDDGFSDVSLWEHYIKSLPAVILAMFGGFVRVVQTNSEIAFTRLITNVVSAAFVGTLLYFLTFDINLPNTTKAAIIGISGYTFSDILPILDKLMKKHIQRKLTLDDIDSNSINNKEKK